MSVSLCTRLGDSLAIIAHLFPFVKGFFKTFSSFFIFLLFALAFAPPDLDRYLIVAFVGLALASPDSLAILPPFFPFVKRFFASFLLLAFLCYCH